MGKTKGMIWTVGVCLLGLTGCNKFVATGTAEVKGVGGAVLPALSFAALLRDGHVYYSVSVQQTSESLQEILRKLGLPVSVTTEPSGVVRISSSTPWAERFNLVLRPDDTRTRVTLEWENGTASQQGSQFLLDLELKQAR
jgi:hypothetical protein